MRTYPVSSLSSRVAGLALALALVVGNVSVAWGQGLSPGISEGRPDLPDPKPLTPTQEAAIRDEMGALAMMLVQGGKTPDEAKLAANAVGICLGAAYGYDLKKSSADAVCGEVLDAYIIQPGTIRYELTPADRAWVAEKVQDWTSELSAVLDPPQIGAVQTTMQACLEGYMKRGEEREGSVKRCLLGLMPLLNRPEFRQRILEAVGKLT
jgi:hypothetical protein